MLPGWVIAVSEPRAEAKAVSNARQLGYDVFFPKIVRRRRHNGKRSTTVFPLFPSYFFAWVEARWTQLLDANGVAGLLMQGETIATIKPATMKELKDRCDKNGIYRDSRKPTLQIGQRVRAVSGVLTDKVGIFDGVSGQQEVALFDLLGAQTRVLFKEGTLTAA